MDNENLVNLTEKHFVLSIGHEEKKIGENDLDFFKYNWISLHRVCRLVSR